MQIGYNAKSRAVGLRPAAEGARGTVKLRRQPKSRSRLVDARHFFAHHGLAVEGVRGLAVEEFGGGVVGFRLPEKGAATEEPVKAPKVAGRRKATG